MADEDRTEAATPRRLQRAREAGQVAHSREVSVLASLGAATLLITSLGPSMGHELLRRAGAMLQIPPAGDVPGAFASATTAVLFAAGPIVLGALAAGVSLSLLQTGLVFNVSALLPDFGRLDPMRGIRRIFGPTGLIEAGKALVKLAILGFASFHVVAAAIPRLTASVLAEPVQLGALIAGLALQLAFTLLGAQLLIAGADLAYVRWRFAQQLRMSREEVRQEAKESDGNPHVKRRLKQIRMARARRRMLAAVPTATVIVTNPTHYAIALSYDRMKGGAPRVVAKGVDEIAARIREVATEHRVPLVSNPPLARALYRVELDAEIPAEHFKVVAEIIAYVWRLRGRVARR